MADGPILGDFDRALIGGITMLIAISLLPEKIGQPSHRVITIMLLLAFVIAHSIAYWTHPREQWAGLFSNIHYLALYSVITLPVFFYFLFVKQSIYRWISGIGLTADVLLMLESHSRPGYLACLASALVIVPMLAPRFRMGVICAVIIVPIILYVTNPFHFSDRINDLIIHFSQEERPSIWRETWNLMMKSSWSEWWFGHGLGQFYEDYQVIPEEHEWKSYYASPHNYFLELLYSHGWTGLFLFVISHGMLFFYLFTSISHSSNTVERQFGLMLLSSITAHIVMGFFTFPFFSRHNIYPFSLVLGASARYIAKVDRYD